jgi:hypothetical protein
MDHYNRSNSSAWRRNEEPNAYGPDRSYNDYDERSRNYYGSDRASYDNSRAWPDRDRHAYNEDRNMFERMGDRIRDTWNEWTGPGHRNEDRYYRDNRDPRSYEHTNRRQRYDHDDRNMFERAGEKIRDFFSAPGDDYGSGRYRQENRGGQEYGQRGFGNYDGNYGAYTGMHGVTGYNTGTRDNFTTDYDRHYRPRYDNDMYHEDEMNRRYGQRDGRYNYRPGDYGQVEIGEFRARERYNMSNQSRFRDDYRR